MEMPYYDEKAVDEANVKAGNGQTQDNRSSNQPMTKNWVAGASPWKRPKFQERWRS